MSRLPTAPFSGKVKPLVGQVKKLRRDEHSLQLGGLDKGKGGAILLSLISSIERTKRGKKRYQGCGSWSTQTICL